MEDLCYILLSAHTELYGNSQTSENEVKTSYNWWEGYFEICDTDVYINPGPEEANWSGSALFVIKYVNLYQQPGAWNLTG